MVKADDFYKNIFEKNLTEQGYSQTKDTENTYQITWNNNPARILTIHLIGSEKIDSKLHGSHNGNKIQAIGYFRFELPPPGVSEPDFIIFRFQNQPNDSVEFLIIPTVEIRRRYQSKSRTKKDEMVIELQFWIMEDNYVFETMAGISGEGEWWFINGRMAEQTDWDYTEFLNNWDGMKMT
jgi:hypothetical protein